VGLVFSNRPGICCGFLPAYPLSLPSSGGWRSSGTPKGTSTLALRPTAVVAALRSYRHPSMGVSPPAVPMWETLARCVDLRVRHALNGASCQPLGYLWSV
jgi:hypothetical protein